VTTQAWDTEGYDKNARFVTDLGAPVLELLAPKPGEHILDVGCGDGILTKKIADLGCSVVGVDSSAQFVTSARKLGLTVVKTSASEMDFGPSFDAVFSNAALHWMRNPEAVISGAFRALRPNGRFVAEFGGHGCVAKIKKALVAALNRRGLDGKAAVPWYFPTVEEYSALLKNAGFSISAIALIPRPTPLPGDVTGWLETFGESFTACLPLPERPAYIAEVREALRPKLSDSEGKWTADYVRLRFSATKQV
jgi:SAM-dependent methyltransferase